MLDISFGGIPKQRLQQNSKQLFKFYSGVWIGSQLNCSTIKNKILSNVLCISKFQDDLYYKKFILRIDCKNAKEIPQKDVQIARWQAILSVFNFDIEFINGTKNSLPDFLTREFLQGK